MCLEICPAYTHVVLRPRPSYVHRVPTTPFKDQMVNLIPQAEADPALSFLCLVHVMLIYLDHTESFKNYEHPVSGDSKRKKGCLQAKTAHWIVDAISLAYQSLGVPCLLGV